MSSSASANLNYYGSVVPPTSSCEFQRNLQSSKNEDHGTGRGRLSLTLRPHSHLLHDGPSGRPEVVGASSASKWPDLPGPFPQRFNVSSCGAQLTCESFLGRRTHIRLQDPLRGERPDLPGPFPQRFNVSSCGAQLTCESFLGRRTHIRLQDPLRGESVHLRGLRDKPESCRAARFRRRRTRRS